MAKTIEQLKAQGAEVKNATVVGENTATRVGTLFNDIVEHVEDYETKQAERDTEQDNTAASLISAEKERAMAAEKANAQAIAELKSETDKQENNYKELIKNETDRATFEEEKLNSKIGNKGLIMSQRDGYNIVNPENVFKGLMYADGSDNGKDTHRHTGYIAVNNQNIRTTDAIISSSYPSYVVFDENYTFLRSIKGTDKYSYVEGDFYVKIGFKAGKSTDFMANYGDEKLPYEEYTTNPIFTYYDIELLNNEINNNKIDIFNTQIQLDEKASKNSVFAKANLFINSSRIISDSVAFDENGTVIDKLNNEFFGGQEVKKNQVICVEVPSGYDSRFGIALFTTLEGVAIGSQASQILYYKENLNSESLSLTIEIKEDGYLCATCYATLRTKIQFYYSRLNIDIDDSLSETSTNPLQNKVISTEINYIKNEIQPLPEKYKEYLNTKLDDIYNVMLGNGEQCDSFIFFTDSHWYYSDGALKVNYMNLPLILHTILEKTSINKIVFGGDMIYANSDTEHTKMGALYMQRYMRKCIAPYAKCYQVQGNHDIVNSSSTTPTYSQNLIRNLILADVENDVILNTDDPVSTYYYFDNKAKRIRYIIFQGTRTNQTDRDNYISNSNKNTNSISDEQIKWIIENAVITLQSGWRIVAFCHFNVGSVIDPSGGNYNSHGKMLELFKAINNKRTLILGDDTYNFADLDNVKVILYQSGHQHADLQTYQDGVLTVTTTSDGAFSGAAESMYFSHSLPRGYTALGIVAEKAGKSREDIIGTDEHVADFVNIDCTNDLVTMVRIGAYYNRMFHTDIKSISIGDTIDLNTSLNLTGAVSWHIYDSDANTSTGITFTVEDDGYFTTHFEADNNSEAATVTDGIVTAKATGNVVVMAMDINQNKEHWNIIIN